MTLKTNLLVVTAICICLIIFATCALGAPPTPTPDPPTDSDYTVNASAGPHGSVNPSSVTVSSGDSATFTATPDLGFVVDTWFLDGSVFQVGGTTCTVSQIDADHNLNVTFKAALAYSLGEIEFDNEQEYLNLTVNNNMIDPDQPEQTRLHVERIVGVGPDPGNAVMRMRNLQDLDSTSPTYGKFIHARVKGTFHKTDVDEILVCFAYLFEAAQPGVELRVYLSDSANLLEPDDPARREHYLLVGQLAVPPFPLPGSAGSNRFGIFIKRVWIGHLNLSAGLYIELELAESSSEVPLVRMARSLFNASGAGSVFIDDWSSRIECFGICLDVNWDNFVDESDFLMVIGSSGCVATDERACLDGAWSADGYVDSYDVVSWDWALNSNQRLLNYCGVPLVDRNMSTMSSARLGSAGSKKTEVLSVLPDNLGDLLIAGKSGAPDARSKLKDSLYSFNTDSSYIGRFAPPSDRCNIRLISGPGGEVYQLNSETGLHRLDKATDAVIPPAKIRLTNINEPRYNGSSTVYFGIQGNDSDAFGRPLLDAAFDADFVYVVPVVLDPDGGEPYMAAAKLRLLENGNPPYEIVRLYDDPPQPNDNQYRNHLRELELDSAGNLYVLNVHAINESDILWRYAMGGSVERVDLGRPDGDCYVPAPMAMCASKKTAMLYLASAIADPADNDTSVVYGLSTQGALAIEKRIRIAGMYYITGMTEDPQTGTIWITGFGMYSIPQYPDPRQQAFYYPYLARIPADSNPQTERIALPLYDPDNHDLALPISILWTGATEQSQMGLHKHGSSSLRDLISGEAY